MMRNLSGPLLALMMTIPLFGTGCAEHRRVEVWAPGETTYYVEWEHETHRHHVDYDRRSSAEQKEYWKWRHHHDHD